jgi:hypothetical protein
MKYAIMIVIIGNFITLSFHRGLTIHFCSRKIPNMYNISFNFRLLLTKEWCVEERRIEESFARDFIERGGC